MTVYYITVGGYDFPFVAIDGLLNVHNPSFKNVHTFLSDCGFTWEDNHYGKLGNTAISFSMLEFGPIVPLVDLERHSSSIHFDNKLKDVKGERSGNHGIYSWIATYLANALVGNIKGRGKYSPVEYFKRYSTIY